MNFSLQDKPRSNQMADSRFPTAVISHFYSAVYETPLKAFFTKKAAEAIRKKDPKWMEVDSND